MKFKIEFFAKKSKPFSNSENSENLLKEYLSMSSFGKNEWKLLLLLLLLLLLK